MAIALTQVGLDKGEGNEKRTRWDAVLSGTFVTAGEVITPVMVRLGRIDEIVLPPASAGGLYQIQPVYNADGSVNLVFTEAAAGAAGTQALQVKTNSEAYTASTGFRFSVLGPWA